MSFESLELENKIRKAIRDDTLDLDTCIDELYRSYSNRYWFPKRKDNVKRWVEDLVERIRKNEQPLPRPLEWIEVLHQHATSEWKRKGATAASIGQMLCSVFGKFKTLTPRRWEHIAREARPDPDVEMSVPPSSDEDDVFEINTNDDSKHSDMDADSDDEDVHECSGCLVHTDQVFWRVECSMFLCFNTGHHSCLIPALEDEKRIYCTEHWLVEYVNLSSEQVSAFDGTGIRLIRKLQTPAKCMFFFANAQQQVWMKIRTEHQFEQFETNLIEQYECKFRQLHLCYSLEPGSTISMTISKKCNPRKVSLQLFQMHGCRIPLVVVNNFLSPSGSDWLTERGLYFYEHQAKLAIRYPLAVQASGNRVKVACNVTYKTPTKATAYAEPEIETSDMSYATMFLEKSQRDDIRQICRDLHAICTVLKIKDIGWLIGSKLTKDIPFLLTTYCGLGLRSHIDLFFEGPVFVIHVLITPQDGKENEADPHETKKISFGMHQGKEINSGASITNTERQLYFFYGYFTDWAHHRVPMMKAWKSVVLIIRCGRVHKILRS